MYQMESSTTAFGANRSYNESMRKSVRKVDESRPNATTTARGGSTSEPMPVEIAIGIKPTASVIAVARTGISLRLADVTTISI